MFTARILPVVFDKEVQRVKVQYDYKLFSPSELEIFALCKRKWAWRYVAKHRSPPNASAQLGLDNHDELEQYLKIKKIPTSDILIPALEHFPLPGPNVIAERMIGVEITLNGKTYAFHGKIDVTDNNIAVPEFFDLKTTGDFKWAKSEKVLLTDFQTNIYALAILVEADAQATKATWVYARTQKPYKTLPVSVTLTKDQILNTLITKILPICDEINELLIKPPPPLDVIPNYTACSAFGGCPHRETDCNIGAKQKFISIMAQSRERSEHANKHLKLVDTTESSTMPSAKEKMQALLDKKKGTVAVEEATARVEKVPVQASKQALDKNATGLNPPDASPNISEETQETPPVEVPAEDPSKSLEKKKGRPKKSEGASNNGTNGVATDDAGPFVLYIDCFVAKGTQAVKDVDVVVAPVRAELEKEFEIEDYRLMEYNKGPATLAAGLRSALKSKMGVYSVFTDTVDREVLSALIERATMVIRSKS